MASPMPCLRQSRPQVEAVMPITTELELQANPEATLRHQALLGWRPKPNRLPDHTSQILLSTGSGSSSAAGSSDLMRRCC